MNIITLSGIINFVRISAANLRKYFESPAGILKVLENINIEVPSGDFVAIMGPSGCGKSSLLFLLGCLDIPTFGSIYLDNIEITQQTERVREQLRLLKVGFVFQNFHLIPTLTVQENIMLPMMLAGSYPNKQEQRSITLLRIVGLEERLNDRPVNLSGGQQQRVAVARALANMPGLILADEPTGNLDVKTGKELMEVLRTINENQGITLIIVTHDPKVASYAKRIYYLDEGKLSATVI